jgi:hypothetical protein
VDLVQRDHQPNAVGSKEVRDQLDLVPQPRLDHMGVDGAPVDAGSPERSERDVETCEPPADSLGVQITEKQREMLADQPVHEAGIRRLADDHPSAASSLIFDRVQQDRLSGTPGPGVEGGSRRRAGAFGDRFGDRCDEAVPAGQERRADAKARVEGVRGHRVVGYMGF